MKRKRGAHVGGRPPKRSRNAGSQSPVATTAASVDHPVLARIYPELLALRHYLLSQLPSSSKNRRRRILQLGRPAKHPLPDSATHALDVDLARLLDTTLVAVPPNSNVANPDRVARERERDLESFSQERPYGATGATFKEGYFLQSEVGLRVPFRRNISIHIFFNQMPRLSSLHHPITPSQC
ncbi:hypothetical protein BS50DRAFT_575538 [Corynespora cassiicola Philippines]|uniref:Uncharacterized protein n=1 Tax=Corynespora cassiicola Philippines TaxID=1448308 RepID=A0A2T2NKJ3_CORCC|nr:hypothetical protein BS50DRAFT_575538 [Corynespora cassiicola Philippines]